MSSSPEYLDALRLTPHEAIDLLEDMESQPGEGQRGESFRRPGVPLIARQPTGEQARYLVFTDRLWAGGLTCLHGGYLHAGLGVRITLDPGEEALRIDGGVVHCKHLRGRVHLLEIAFSAPLEEADVRRLAAPPTTAAAQTHAPVDPATLTGSVLHIEHSESDHRMLLHCTKGTKLRVSRASSGAKAIARMRESKIDAVLTDLDLGDTTGEELIPRLRGERYDGPIGVVTRVTEKTRLRAAIDAGACDVLLKPFEPERLLQSLARMLPPGDEGGGASGAETTPAATQTPPTDTQVIHRSITELSGAVRARDYDLVESLCLCLHNAADQLGLSALAGAADRVLDALNRSGSVAGAAGELRSLLDRCQRDFAS